MGDGDARRRSGGKASVERASKRQAEVTWRAGSRPFVRPAAGGNESGDSLGRQEVGRGGAKETDWRGSGGRWLVDAKTDGTERNIPPRRAPPLSSREA